MSLRRVVPLKLVLLDGSTPSVASQVAQEIDVPSGCTEDIPFACVGQNGQPVDLTNGAVVLSVKLKSTDKTALISRQATFTNQQQGTGKFPLVPADTLSLLGLYGATVEVEWADDGSRDQLLVLSPFRVLQSNRKPTDPITVPVTQPAVGQGPVGATGPAGKPPTYATQTTDGVTQATIASYLMVNNTQLHVDLRVLGAISPDPGDGGLGEVSIDAYFTCDGSGNVSIRSQDPQQEVISASWAALAQRPAISARVVGSRVDILLTGAPSTTINWQTADVFTMPPVVGANAGAVGPQGQAGVQGPPGQAPQYKVQTADGVTPQQFCSYAMAVSSALAIHLRILAFDVTDGSVSEYSLDSFFKSDGGGNISQIGTDEVQTSGSVLGGSFPSSPVIASAISGSSVVVNITGAAAKTIVWVATDTQTIPSPPGAQGPPGPVGPVGPIGPAGVPFAANATTADATPTTLATYPVAASSYRMVDIAMIAFIPSTGALAVVYLTAFAVASGLGVITLSPQDVRIVPKIGTWPAGTFALLIVSGSNVVVQVVGAAGTTIAWAIIDWTTIPALSLPAVSPPAIPSYATASNHFEMVLKNGAIGWRQHETAEVVADGSTNTWIASWPDFQSRTFKVRVATTIPSSGGGTADATISAITSTGCTVQVPDGWAGSIELDILEIV